MNKLSALFNLFRKGSSVSDPAAWKNKQITATVLGAFILALINVLAAFGYALPIDTETANAIAGGIIAIVNVLLTVTTTEKVGLPAKHAKVPPNDSTKESRSDSATKENAVEVTPAKPTDSPAENIYIN